MIENPRLSTSSSRYHQEDNDSSNCEKGHKTNEDIDEERTVGVDGTELAATKEGDIGSVRGRGQSRRSQDSRSLRTTRSHQSRAGGDGYTCFDAEPGIARPNNSKPGVVTEQPYLVTWDGDADPLNPRSMSKLRRWIIVLICSASSLCV